MKILSNPILDKKINSYNFLVEMSMNEYYSLVLECIKNNEFQRVNHQYSVRWGK